METKWLAGIVVVFLLSMAGSAVYDIYSKKECRIELAKAGKSTDDIAKLCR